MKWTWKVAARAALAVAATVAAAGCGPPNGPGTQVRYPQFAYMVHPREQTVSVYQVLAPTGRLRPLGYVPVSDLQRVKVAGDWLVVEHITGAELRRIDAASGFPARSATATLPSCLFMWVSADGNLLFCHDNGMPRRAHAFRLDQQTGSVQEIGSAVMMADQLMAVDPLSRFLLAVNYHDHSFTPLKLSLGDPNAVVAGTGWAPAGTPFFAAIAPSGGFAYVGVEVVGTGEHSLQVFAMNADGTPAGAALQTVPITTGRPGIMKLSPTGTELFISGPTPVTVSYLVDPATGMLTPSGRTFPAGNPSDLAIDPFGRFVYSLAFPGGPVNVLDVRISQSAGLADSFQTAWQGESMVIKTGPAPVTTISKFLLVSDFAASKLRSFAIDQSNGTLLHVGDGAIGAGGATAFATSADGRFVYVASPYTNKVTAFAIDGATGGLTMVNAPVSLSGRPALALPSTDLDGLLYVLVVQPVDPNGHQAWEISVSTVDPATGAVGVALPPLAPSLQQPSTVAVSNVGDTLLVTDAGGSGQLDLFVTQPAVPSSLAQGPLGAMTPAFPTRTSPPPSGYTSGAIFDPFDRLVVSWGSTNLLWPTSGATLNPAFEVLATPTLPFTTLHNMAVSFDGRGVFAVAEDVNDQTGVVGAFDVDVPAGKFVSKQFEVQLPDTVMPVAACADATGRWFYVLDQSHKRIFLYDRDQASGALHPITVGVPQTTQVAQLASRASYVAADLPWDMQVLNLTQQ